MTRHRCTSTAAEKIEPMVGDELCSCPQFIATRSIDISAPPEHVFAWIRQMGFKKAGWYSYDLIDNLGRKSATRIHPEWQNVHNGDVIPGGPISFTALHVLEPHTFVLLFTGSQGVARRICFTLAYEVRAQEKGTRLVTRVRICLNFPLGSLIAKTLLGPGDGFMVRKQLRTLKMNIESVD